MFVLTIQITKVACLDANCQGENCTENIEVPMMDRMKAPLTADFDITELTKQLRKLVKVEVQQSVKRAVKAEMENIVKNNIQEAENKLSTNITNAVSEMKDYLEDSATKSITELDRWKKETDKKIDSTTQSIKELNENNIYVGLTSCVKTTTTVSVEQNIIFPKIMTQFGISNTSAFTSTGIFTCQYPGLYFVSVTILSRSYDAAYQIKLNSSVLTTGFVSRVNSQETKEDNNFHTGTSMIVISLKQADQISVVTAYRLIEVHSWHSCITIIKIK